MKVLDKSEDYSTNYGFLKRIISADDVVSDSFQWHTRQNEGITGTYQVRESSFNMTRGRGGEDIEGELWKFLDTRRGGSEKLLR